MSVLMPIPHYLDSYSFIVNFEIENCESSNFALPVQDCFSYSGSHDYQTHFRIGLSVSIKKPDGILI